MRFLEVFDEFENIKHTTAAEKLKYGTRRFESLKHEAEVLVDFIYKFEGKKVRNQYETPNKEHSTPLTPTQVAFESRNGRGSEWYAIYDGLTPQETRILELAYKKYLHAADTARKLEKNITTLKRNAAKEAGTFVSAQLLGELEKKMHNELTQVVINLGQDLDITKHRGWSRTGRGDSHFTFDIGANDNKPMDNQQTKLWRIRKKKLHEDIKAWLDQNGLAYDNRVSISTHNVEIRINTKAMTDRLKKKGLW